MLAIAEKLCFHPKRTPSHGANFRHNMLKPYRLRLNKSFDALALPSLYNNTKRSFFTVIFQN